MPIINRIPRGFLDLLGVQAQGRNPPQYANVVAPVVDLSSLYLAETLSSVHRNVQHVLNSVTNTGVPAGETWILVSIGVSEFHIGITEFAVVRFALDNQPRTEVGTAPAVIAVTDPLTTTIANQIASHAILMTQPLVLHSGTVIESTIIQRDVGAGVRGMDITYGIYRLNS